ncbi:hypothetical protein ACO0LF_29975 [Undibacterium sp. Di27W]
MMPSIDFYEMAFCAQTGEIYRNMQKCQGKAFNVACGVKQQLKSL